MPAAGTAPVAPDGVALDGVAPAGASPEAGPADVGTAPPHLLVELAVPAYVHPSTDPQFWHRLADSAAHVRFVVVNVHNGPGERPDPGYPPVLRRLAAAGARTIGYVDTDYGRRPMDDVVAEARSWVITYGVRGVFFDQSAGDFEHLEYYAACALGARACGAQFVVLNPGTACHPGYTEIANVTVTFEGVWADYLEYRPETWMRHRPADRFAHLVYDVPAERVADGPRRAATLNAASAYFTPGGGDNPWDQLPDDLLAAVVDPHPVAPSPGLLGVPTWGRRRYVNDRPDYAAPVVEREPASRRARRPGFGWWPGRLPGRGRPEAPGSAGGAPV